MEFTGILNWGTWVSSILLLVTICVARYSSPHRQGSVERKTRLKSEEEEVSVAMLTGNICSLGNCEQRADDRLTLSWQKTEKKKKNNRMNNVKRHSFSGYDQTEDKNKKKQQLESMALDSCTTLLL